MYNNTYAALAIVASEPLDQYRTHWLESIVWF